MAVKQSQEHWFCPRGTRYHQLLSAPFQGLLEGQTAWA